jgi:RecA/RadA recombinase
VSEKYHLQGVFILTGILDRLPTVSASQALFNSNVSAGAPCISTGLTRLDSLIHGREAHSDDAGIATGVSRGQVTEIYGPPGSGKTSFA